ncbi:methylamine utilization protein MauJ [Ilumatobacter sp.]|uniref:methylamine utilization protein MauJ n=1 Tax=Ilumatobacter sp. TaxID=1967498 RepID=UPI00375054DC
MSIWDDLTWLIVFNGMSDASLWGFDAANETWHLAHGSRASGMLGVLPWTPGGRRTTRAEAVFIADAIAFDHDAPIGVRPRTVGYFQPTDLGQGPDQLPPGLLSINPHYEWGSDFYWETINSSLAAAAELRFNGDYCLRYQSGYPDPGTNFTERFAETRKLLALYAMAARQADPLSEYLCLYRVLEGADERNGMTYAAANLDEIAVADFGLLRILPPWGDDGGTVYTSAFESYRYRARLELARLAQLGADVPPHLYNIRNGLAHGKHETITGLPGSSIEDVLRALPIVKLLARLAVQPAK